MRAAYSELLPETTLAQSGLTRPWFGQVEIDRGRTRISNLALCEGVLYAQTNSAMVHAIDAETGKTLWSQQVGKSNHPSPPLEARGDLVAVVNGSRLYVLNRANGDLLYQRQIQDAPGSGPALSSKRAFVPMVTGMMTAYQFPRGVGSSGEPAKAKKDTADKQPSEADRQAEARAIQATVPLCCQSYGRALVQPLVTRDFVGGEYVVWSTDRGYLNFGRIERDSDNVLALKYRLETGGAIVSRPAYLPPNPKVLGDAGIVFAASTDGFVYAVQQENGSTLWRFSSGEPILQSPAVIDNRVFVTTELGAMYCLAAKTGKNLWSVQNVTQFVAASKSRIYVADRIGRLLVLNADSGARLGAIPAENATIKLVNADTDRIYLADDGGLIQCLHEIEQTEPLEHGKLRKEAARAESKRQIEAKPVEQKPAAEEKPEKPAKKEYVPPKPSTTPKKPAVPKVPKTPKVRKPGKRVPGGNNPPGVIPPGAGPGIVPPGGPGIGPNPPKGGF